jgi:MarR family 2-MHQ and catechol resistance regulon transcriptional repressor
MTEPNPKNADFGEDMNRIRAGMHSHCANFGECDFDSVNALLTLKRTTADLENFGSGYFKQYDLSPGRFNVLMSLFGAPNHTQSLSDLGDFLVVTRANITGLVDGLVEDGLIRRIDHPDDRRVVLAQLTEKATTFLTWFAPQHHKNIKHLMSIFTPDEKREFVKLLDKLRAQRRDLGSLKDLEARSAVKS